MNTNMIIDPFSAIVMESIEREDMLDIIDEESVDDFIVLDDTNMGAKIDDLFPTD